MCLLSASVTRNVPFNALQKGRNRLSHCFGHDFSNGWWNIRYLTGRENTKRRRKSKRQSYDLFLLIRVKLDVRPPDKRIENAACPAWTTLVDVSKVFRGFISLRPALYSYWVYHYLASAQLAINIFCEIKNWNLQSAPWSIYFIILFNSAMARANRAKWCHWSLIFWNSVAYLM